MKENISKPATSPDFNCTQKVLFEQEASSDEGGIKYEITLRAITKDSEVMEFNGTKAYVGVYLTDGSIRVIGTADEAPELSISPAEGGVYVLSLSFETLSPIDL